MTADFEPGSNYVVQVADPANPKKVIGYAFSQHVSFFGVDETDENAKAMVASAEKLFRSRARKLKAVALPGADTASKTFFAQGGSGHRDAL